MENKTIQILVKISQMLESSSGNVAELQDAFPEIIECVLEEANLLNLPSELWSDMQRDVIEKVKQIEFDNEKSNLHIAAILREVANNLTTLQRENQFYIQPDDNARSWKMEDMGNYISNDKYIFLDSQFELLWNKLQSNENFTLLRWGDGERSIMIGKEVHAQEGWSVPGEETNFGKALYKTLQLADELVWHGISCPCCDPQAYYWYRTNMKSNQITFANIWVNSNYENFITRFSKLKRDAIVIGNYIGKGKPIGNLNILKYYEVSDDCLSFFNGPIDNLIQEIKNDYGKDKGLLYVVAAGPLSEYIIAELFKVNKENCYVDFGSSIDFFIHNKLTRPYMEPTTKYAQMHCWMHDSAKVPTDVTVVMTLYKRPEVLLEQLEALENQTLKPKEILLFQDAIPSYYQVCLSEEIKNRFDNVKICDENEGVWGRFDFARTATSNFVCLFDDDTIPGNRWLENCHMHMIQKEGVYGTIGILMKEDAIYPTDGYFRIGWAAPYQKTLEVDLVGHSWFIKREYLNYMIEGSEKLRAKFKYVGEDMFLSYQCQKEGIKTFVPIHPMRNQALWGSNPKLAYQYGTQKVAISKNKSHLKDMYFVLQEIRKSGWKSISSRHKDYFEFIKSNAKDLGDNRKLLNED